MQPTGPTGTSQPADSGIDEVQEYMNCRYLSSCKAMWRLFQFGLHVRVPAVERLEIHLPGMNRVTYSEDDSLMDVVSRHRVRKSSLTEWFAMNERHEHCRDLTYCEFPNRFTWYGAHTKWVPRARGVKVGVGKIGRVRYVHPTTGELFYLRMLLMSARGARGFDDLKTYGGVVYGTFREACRAWGLLGDDAEWSHVFNETILLGMTQILPSLLPKCASTL
jgi:hypothetical protein